MNFVSMDDDGHGRAAGKGDLSRGSSESLVNIPDANSDPHQVSSWNMKVRPSCLGL